MRICRFNANRLGVIQGDQVLDVTGALAVLPASSYPLPGHDLLVAHLGQVRAHIEAILPSGTPEGVGPMLPGDRIATEFQGIGRMDVAVRAAP